MKRNYFFLTAVFFSHATLAQTVTVSDGWVRATVQGQRATGAFMRLTAKESAKLVAGSSSAAGIVEIHEMKMDNDV
ncbi:MAG: copper chaperone PCu(A)C, partial [Betaproteobacteria bacterium]|nr:copper chaperone PCu(A)C [Betaproteobacteria bacterium]